MGQNDLVWSSGFPKWRGRLGRGGKPGSRADLISQDKTLSTLPRRTREACLDPAQDPAGTSDLLPRLQAPTSMHLCLCGPEGASPFPAVSTGNRSSARLGYQASRQRAACLFEKRLL